MTPFRTFAAALPAALLLSAAPAAAQPLASGQTGTSAYNHFQKEGGVVFGANIGTDLSFLTFGLSQSSGFFGALNGGFSVGGKTGRAIISVGLDMSNITSIGSSSTSRGTTFLFVPSVQIALARSMDRRVELPLLLQLGLGGTFTDGSGSGSTPMAISYRLGLGARYWAHPQFALQLYGGFSGLWSLLVSGSGRGRGSGLNGTFASLGALTVF